MVFLYHFLKRKERNHPDSQVPIGLVGKFCNYVYLKHL